MADYIFVVARSLSIDNVMMFLVSRELFLQIHNRCIITIGTSLIKDIIHKVMKRGLFIYIYVRQACNER